MNALVFSDFIGTTICAGYYTFLGTNWTVYWSVNGSNITFRMYGPADGWIGVGVASSGGLYPVSFATSSTMHSNDPPAVISIVHLHRLLACK